jgi:glycosyltransferase involved in cell wall biosynthesis
MNILINIPDLNKGKGGVYQYSIGLIKTLLKADLPCNFFIYTLNRNKELEDAVAPNSNFIIVETQLPFLFKFKKRLIWFIDNLSAILKLKKRYRKIDEYDYLINKYNLDIIHTPSQDGIVNPRVKTISTLHDIQELHFPEFFTPAQRLARATKHKKAIEKSDAIVVSYNHVNLDIEKFFYKPKEQIFTILLDMENLWFDNLESKDTIEISSLKLPSNFLLYPAATWAHKNHRNLIKAIHEIESTDFNLVCTGGLIEPWYSELKELVKSLKLENQIHFLGIVSNETLYALYKKCKFVVVPTLYEAGSFPLMESILLDVPVICSNVTSLPETIGDNRFVFDPTSILDIKNKIEKMWNDNEFIKENLFTLKQSANALTNNKAGEKFYDVYKSLMKDI